MERSSITKWLLLGLAAFLFWQYGRPLIFGRGAVEQQSFTIDYTAPPAAERTAEELCQIDGSGFTAKLSTQGAALRSFVLTDGNYYRDDNALKQIELVKTTDQGRLPLRTDLRVPGDTPQQVAYNDLDWKLGAQDGKSCTFTFTSDTTSLTKTIAATGKPFELAVDLKVQNLAAEPKKHRLAIEQTSYELKKDTEGSLGRQSQQLTETMTGALVDSSEKSERQAPSDFAPDALKKKEFTQEKWRRSPGDPRFVAVSSNYFTRLAVPLEAPGKPTAETRIEDIFNPRFASEKEKDPSFGHTYRARLAYPEIELKPQEAVEYQVLTFNGPKDRGLLGAMGHGVTDVLNLGMFAPIARALVGYLHILHGFTGSWGIAIILMTITVRTALFPLSLTQIKSSIAMRKLKPEMDALNEKYKDDATQRGLATQELWKKNGVTNPVLGCLPMLLQMPVWWALYSALQTAVELYHVPFGPFIPDLASPGKYFIIPIVLGASSFIQQKMMPPQGDAQQQKMMLYMMPAVFTFMMLFLPAGLGVYMLTNTWLGIGQQLLVERYLKAKANSPGTIEVREKTEGDGGKPTPTLGKGKARVRG
ncbi:MAG: membrane protein insertase YidC [Byssovorax sp.]